MAPVWVRMARSFPLERITLSPVCLSGSRRTAETSTPCLVISSSMKRPKMSAPHTPTKATFNPRRAAPHAKIAEEEPMVSAAESTNFSTCPNEGTTSPVRMRSGLISPGTMRSKDFDIFNHKGQVQVIDQDRNKPCPVGSIGFIPIDRGLSGVKIADGFANFRAQRCQTGETFAPGSTKKFESRLPIQFYSFLPDSAPNSTAGGSSTTGNLHLTQVNIIIRLQPRERPTERG